MDSKRMIVDALFNLASKKDIEKITVKDILDLSTVSRATFYSHFKDKYDAINWYCAEKAGQILHAAQSHGVKQAILEMNRWTAENMKFSRIYYFNSTDTMSNYQQNYFAKFLASIYLTYHRKAELSKQDELKFAYIVNGTFALLKEWVRCGCTPPYDVFSELEWALLAPQLGIID